MPCRLPCKAGKGGISSRSLPPRLRGYNQPRSSAGNFYQGREALVPKDGLRNMPPYLELLPEKGTACGFYLISGRGVEISSSVR